MQVRSLEKSRHHLVATAIAEDLVEQAMERGYERSQTTEVDSPNTDEIEMQTEHKGADGQWSSITVRYRTEEMIEEIGTSDDKLKKVTIRVAWDDTGGGGNIKLVTYLAGVF